MAKLDTRGFMDGALRGFEVMSNYQNNKADRERQDDMQREQMSLRQAESKRQETAHRSTYGYTDENGAYVPGSLAKKQAQDEQVFNRDNGYIDENGNKVKGLVEKKFEQDSSLNNERVTTQRSLQKLNEAKLKAEQKRKDYIEKKALREDNKQVTEQKWIDVANGNFDEEYFNQDHIKGTPQDIRTWDDKKIKTLEAATANLRDIVSGESSVNNDKALRSFEALYSDLFAQSVGSVDTSNGKVIKSYNVEKIHMESDINPDVPGDQGGVVILGKVTYDDGTTALKPVTENRSTDPNDPVKVIPVERIIADLTQQTKMARVATAARKGGVVFKGEAPDKDYAQKKELKYIDKMTEPNKAKNQDIGKLFDPTPEEIAQVEARYEASANELKQQLSSDKGAKPGRFSSEAIKWAEGDPNNNIDDVNKMQFLSDLTRKGYDISTMNADFLEKQYGRLMQRRQANWQQQQQQPQQQPQQQQPGLSSPQSSSLSILNSIIQRPNP